MENASKALLIAGAILLVIAIIAIGMVILGQGQDVVDKTGGQIDAMSVNAHNSQFANIYKNAIIDGKTLKDIVVKAASNNDKSSKNKVCNVTVTVNNKSVNGAGSVSTTGDDTKKTISGIDTIQANYDYKITDVGYDAAGAINSISAEIQN